MNDTMIGVDLAKSVFVLHGASMTGVGAGMATGDNSVYEGVRQFAFALQRTELGRAQVSIRLRTAQPMATSVC